MYEDSVLHVPRVLGATGMVPLIRSWPRPFRWLIAGQLVSLIGDGMANVALIYAVLHKSSSATGLGLVFAAQWLPLVGFSLFGGVLADRIPRLQAMIVADLARIVSQGLLAVLVITGQAGLGWFVVFQAVHGAASAVFSPALIGVMPELAAGDVLQQGNSAWGIGEAAGNLAGPALAGLLVVAAGPGWALAADAATFAVSAACLMAASRPVPLTENRPQPGASMLADLRAGWREFRSRAWVWSTGGSAALQNFLYCAFFVLGPIEAQRHYHGVKGWALVLVCAGLGSVAGGSLTLRLRPAHPLRTGCLLVSAYGLPALSLGLGLPIGAVAVAAAVGSAGVTASNALWQTTLQNHVPQQVLSRVSAYSSGASFAAIPLGLALAGPVAHVAGAVPVLTAAGIAQLAAGLAPLAVPDVRHLGFS